MRRSTSRLVKFLGILLLVSMVLSACPAPAVPDQGATSEGAATQPAGTDTQAPTGGEAAGTIEIENEEWWAEAATPYQGVTLRGVSESTPPSRYVSEVLAPAFEALTGIRVELEVTSWDQMYDKAIKDMEAETGIYDFVYVEQDIVYAYLDRDFLVNITQILGEHPELQAPNFDVGNFTSFIESFKDPETGDLYGVPMEAFVKVYLYRKDLFEDTEIQAAFEESYGYPLAPATNFDQYRDIAEFFTQYGDEQGGNLWGTTVQAASGHPASFYEFVETILPSFGVYNWGINTENWAATEEDGGELNSQQAIEALTFWLDMLEYAPPEATSSTWDEVAASFAAGRAAQGWVYGENAAWIATDPERSTVVGNVGVSLPPTAEGVMAEAEAGEGYIGYYDGGAFAIPHSSTNKEAALLWLQFIGLPQVQPEWAAAAARVVMTDTFDDPVVQEINQEVDGYFTLMQEQGPLFAGAPPFPFHAAVREVIAPYIYQAIAGELTAEEALNQAATAANEELAQLGYRQE